MMVSNFAFRSHKSLNIAGIKPFRMLGILVLLIALLSYEPEFIGFVFLFGYALSGPLEWMLGWKKADEDDDIFSSENGNVE